MGASISGIFSIINEIPFPWVPDDSIPGKQFVSANDIKLYAKFQQAMSKTLTKTLTQWLKCKKTSLSSPVILNPN